MSLSQNLIFLYSPLSYYYLWGKRFASPLLQMLRSQY